MAEICDCLETSILKRHALGWPYGVAVIAEGLAEKMVEEEVRF